MRVRGIYCLFLATALTILAGCGGGGGTGGGGGGGVVNPTKAIVKVRTSGTLPSGTTINAIQATVTYPTTKGLSIALLPSPPADPNTPDVVPSGAGSGSILLPNANNTGQIVLGLLNVSGIQSGEFATLTFNIAAGNSPAAIDFAIASGASVITTPAISGMTVEILGVTFQ